MAGRARPLSVDGPIAWAATMALALTFVGGAALAADDAPGRALELHDEARVLYARGQYHEAVAKLEEAVALDPQAKTLHYNLGLIAEKLGDLTGAIGHYRLCLELETDPYEREQLARIIKRLEGARAAGVFEPQPAAAPPPAAPTPAAARPSSPLVPWAWVSGATAVSAFLVATVLASRASALDPDAEETRTGPGVTLEALQEDAADAHDLAVGADVALGVGLVAAATTVVLVLVAASDDEPTTATATRSAPATLALRLGPGRGALSWRF